MAVCELRTQINATTANVGTGMFVSSPAGNDQLYGWIVTASHVAKETKDNTVIVISTKEGKAETEGETAKKNPRRRPNHRRRKPKTNAER